MSLLSTKQATGSAICLHLTVLACFLWGLPQAWGQISVGGRQYYITRYDMEQGLPAKGCTDMAQDRQGRLWIGTYAGLVRFDGWRMEIKNATVNNIWIAPEGHRVLAATDGGLLEIGYGGETTWSEADGLPSSKVGSALHDSSTGRTWIGTSRGLCYLAKGHLSQQGLGPDIASANVYCLLQSSKGTLWASTLQGVFRQEGGGFRQVTQRPSFGLVEDLDGRIWVALDVAGFQVLTADGHDAGIPIPEQLKGSTVMGIDRHPDGSVWLFDFHAAHLYRNGAWDTPVGFPNAEPVGMFVDNSQTVWVHTRRQGVYQLTASIFQNIVHPEISGKVVHDLYRLRSGAVLAATEQGVDICENPSAPKPAFSPFLPASSLPNAYVKSVYEDASGNIWICTRQGLVRAGPDRRVERVLNSQDGLPNDYVRTVLKDREGTLWIGTQHGLATLLPNGEVQPVWLEEQFSGGMILSIFETRSGDIWVCTQQAVWRRRAGKWRREQALDGRAPTNVRFRMHEDAQGAIWVPHLAGITRVLGDSVQTIYNRDLSMPNSHCTYYQVLEDANGNFWLPSDIGIVLIGKQEREAFFAGKLQALRPSLFNMAHGMASQECTGNGNNFISPDGKLWVSTMKGVSIRPLQATGQAHSYLLSAFFESISHEKETLPIHPNKPEVRLGHEQLAFRVNFSCPNFTEAKQIWFKYRLKGFDRAWTETQDRFVSFTNFPAGQYELELLACGNNQICQEVPISLLIYRAPAWHEHPVFWGSAVLATLAGLGLFVRMRIRHLQQQRRKLEVLVQERTEEISLQKEQLETSYLNLELLSDIGKEITHCMTVEDIIDTVYAEVNRLMPAEGFGIGLYHAKANRIEFPGFIEKGEKLPFHYDDLGDNNSLSDLCFNERREIVVNDWAAEVPAYLPDAEVLMGERPESLLYVPLLIKGKAIGNITVQSFARQAYSGRHLQMLRNIATYVAIALENASAYEHLEEEKEKSESLLLNILPKQTAEELKETGKALPRSYASASVMFADFQGFTQLAGNMTPENLVRELDRCFQAFDSIMAKHGLEKIKTIGDAYMCAGGIPVPDEDHAQRCVEAAFDMVRFMEKWRQEQLGMGRPAWALRIGIHSGPVVAGVVGKNKFAYDIWGDTVNTAARMEAASEPGRVNISDATRQLLAQTPYQFGYRGEIDVKGKGKVGMWWVETNA